LILSIVASVMTVSLFGFGGVTVNFDNLKPTTFPPFWTATASPPVDPQHWEIRRDSSAPSRQNVFAQAAGAPPAVGSKNSQFPLAIYDKVMCRDGDLSVKFKITPNDHQAKAAGIVWRYQDQKNYYLLRFSVDEQNIALFRVRDGQTHPIPVIGAAPGVIGTSHELHTGQWYVARVIFRGKNIRVLFGNRQLFDAQDDSLSMPGKTGLWTKGPTLVSFDDFHIDRKG
jgi:hypothetical protein